LQSRTFFLQFSNKFFADAETFLSEADCRSHYVGKLHRAVSLQSQLETSNCSRHSDRAVADDGGFFVELAILADVHLASGFAGGCFAVVEEGSLAVGEPDQHEAAATDIACSGLDHGKSKRDADSGIHGVAAALENLHAGLRTKFLVSHDHAVRAADCLL
jgi:hypothetical protein